MQNAALSSYKGISVTTASRERLILLAYEGTIKFIRQAKESIETNNVQAKCDRLSRATAIIEELANSLNMKEGGEIAESLASLYDYMMRRLCLANLKSNPDILDEVLSLLTTLYEAWRDIIERPTASPREVETSATGSASSTVRLSVSTL